MTDRRPANHHRRDSSSTAPSSPGHSSLGSSDSSLDSASGSRPRVSVLHHDDAGMPVRDEVPLLLGEKIEAVYQDIAFLCPFSSTGTGPIRGTLTITNYRLYFRFCFLNGIFILT